MWRDRQSCFMSSEHALAQHPTLRALTWHSDGDQEMLEWIGAGADPRLKMLVHHDDGDANTPTAPAAACPTQMSARSPMRR